MADQTRYIFVTGGVISGLGKGIVTASLGMLLRDRGYAVTAMKLDPYLNEDAGTMNPIEHGEVFVTHDGLETDQDLGHYERFGLTTGKSNYATLGMVLRDLLDAERRLDFQGTTVELVPDVPNRLIERIRACGVANEADFVLVEIGGTVGEYQIQLFLEAARIMTKQLRDRVAHVHVGYIPYVESLGELKSKPIQLSIQALQSSGIQPDFLICRSAQSYPVDSSRLDKISQNTNLDREDIFLAPDVHSIYEVPLVLHAQKLIPRLLRRLGLTVTPRSTLTSWKKRVERLGAHNKTAVRIGVIGKYQAHGHSNLSDTYVSVVEALRHVESNSSCRILIEWIDAESLERATNPAAALESCDGIIVPQGWGSRGAVGKLTAIQYCREHGVPFLGLCYGFQLAAVEFAQHVLKLDGAHSTEVVSTAPHPIVRLQAGQLDTVERARYGATLRRGAHWLLIQPGSLLHDIYGERCITERYRHRYELNPDYRTVLQEAGLLLTAVRADRTIGESQDQEVVEALELPRDQHPFFVGVQFHPEYQSAFEKPHPLFQAFIQAAVKPLEKEAAAPSIPAQPARPARCLAPEDLPC